MKVNNIILIKLNLSMTKIICVFIFMCICIYIEFKICGIIDFFIFTSTPGLAKLQDTLLKIRSRRDIVNVVNIRW